MAAGPTGDIGSVSRVNGMDLSNACGRAIVSNFLEGDVSGTLSTNHSYRGPSSGNDECRTGGHDVGGG